MLSGTMPPVRVAHIEAREVGGIGARVLVGLDRHAEGAPEQVEVVHVERAEIDLQRVEDVRQAEAEQLRLGAVEVVVELRRRGAEGGEQLLRVELGLLAGFGEQRLRRIVERGAAAPGEILELELEAARRAKARDRGRIEAECEGVGDLHQRRAHGGDDARGVLIGPAFVPGLQDGEFDAGVRLAGEGQEVEAADRDDILHARRSQQGCRAPAWRPRPCAAARRRRAAASRRRNSPGPRPAGRSTGCAATRRRWRRAPRRTARASPSGCG